MPDDECPRCLGAIPSAESKGKHPGALSRWDNETEICSACGTDEAIGNGACPPSGWPILTVTTPVRIRPPLTVRPWVPDRPTDE